MLEKDSKTTDKYKINPRTTVQVKNTKIEDERGNTFFRSELTLKHKPVLRDKPLLFVAADEIEEFVGGIDFEDQQLPLPLEESKG